MTAQSRWTSWKASRRVPLVGGAVVLAVLLVLAVIAAPDPPGGEDGGERRGGLFARGPGENAPAGSGVDTTDRDVAPEVDYCGGETALAQDRGAADPEYSTGQVSFALQFRDEVNPYRLMTMFTLPGEEVEIEAVLTDRSAAFRARAEDGELERTGPGRWRWTAPDRPGLTRLHVRETSTGETMCLSAITMRPYDGENEINGYQIGRYESVPLYNNPVYNVPRGLIEVPDAQFAETWLSPHFQLKQFMCKQESDWPKYLIVRTRMLLKLEMLLTRANELFADADSFAVLSGYRTPWYNAAIGNRTKYSRHCYGDAADIYIDTDGNGWMDDLNGDGDVTTAEARMISGIVEDVYGEPWYMPFVGGMGIYSPAPHRGPFVHVDTRGFRARW